MSLGASGMASSSIPKRNIVSISTGPTRQQLRDNAAVRSIVSLPKSAGAARVIATSRLNRMPVGHGLFGHPVEHRLHVGHCGLCFGME
jgi:hypothetical protein